MRGRHKIFLGMAAGVGKTFRMLQEGRAEAAAGRDVAIGYLEPHDRVETTAQAEGLETIGRRRVRDGALTVEEMDLPEILRRRPELCLIDELAHTNAPGLEHRKRFEDIEAILAAGIDVYSTVNVQHLESLNDSVAELTGVRVRETFPDSVLEEANEVVLVDLTPQALIERLRAGKVYPPERVQAALANFFRIDSLDALREVALRQVAEEVGQQRRVDAAEFGDRHADRLAVFASRAVAERLLTLVAPRPSAQRLLRRAWRSARRLGGELDVLYVDSGRRSDEEERQLAALRRLATALGATFLIEAGDDIADTAARVAKERGTTYILLGASRMPGPLGRLFKTPLPLKLVSLLPGVDIRIVADRSRQEEAER